MTQITIALPIDVLQETLIALHERQLALLADNSTNQVIMAIVQRQLARVNASIDALQQAMVDALNANN